MKCPVCGKAHRKLDVALRCKSEVDNQWTHYVIFCSGMKGGVCEENLSKFSFFNVDYYRKNKKLKNDMEIYIERF